MGIFSSHCIILFDKKLICANLKYLGIREGHFAAPVITDKCVESKGPERYLK